MISEKKNNAPFLEFVESIKHPFLIAKRNGDIALCNKEISSLLNLNASANNLFLSLDSESAKMFSDIFDSVLKNDKISKDSINIKLKNGFEFFSKVSAFPSFTDEGEKVIMLLLIPDAGQWEGPNYLKIGVSFDDIRAKIKNEKIIGVIDEIKTIYPFTFIGRQKIQSEIETFDEMFWIVDANSNYVIVNSNFAKSFGLKQNYFIEKNQRDFVPAYMAGFFDSFLEFIKENQNMVIFEGLPFNGVNIPENYQVIEIPIADYENNLVATIGITQKKDYESEALLNKGYEEIAKEIIQTISEPFWLLDSQGIVKQSNAASAKYVNQEDSDYSFAKIFDDSTNKKIARFIENNNQGALYESVIVKNKIDEKEINLRLIMNKFQENSHLSNHISAVLENEESSSEENSIIKNRGKMFDVLVKSSPEPIFIYDADNLRFLEVNNAAEKLYGFSRAEFLQMDLTDLYTPEDIQTLLDASNKEGVFTGPWKQRKKDGDSVYVEISRHSFKYNESNAQFNFIRNVSEKLEQEQELSLLKSIFENSSDLLFVTDSSGFINQINKTVVDILGYSQEELQDASLATLVRDEERGNVNSRIFLSNPAELINTTIEFKCKPEGFRKFDVTAIPVRNHQGEIEVFNLICKLKKEPETKKIDKPNKKNGNTEEFNPQFFSNIFHEILTPINVILGFVQELDESIENPDEEQKEAVDIINQNRIRLLQTMNLIAEYSEAGQEKYEMKPETISITEVLDSIQKDSEFSEIMAGMNFGKISSSLKFVSDKNKFQSFINSVIKIAYAISREKKIYLSASQYDQENFVLSVKDKANGMTAEYLKRFLQIFDKNDLSTAKDYGFPKMLIRLANRLGEILNVEVKIIEKSGAPSELVFIIPNDITKLLVEDESIADSEKTENFGAAEEIKNYITPFEESKNENHQEQTTVAKIPEVEHVVEIKEEKPPVAQIKKLDVSKLRCLYIEDQIDSQILFKVQMKDFKDIKFAVSFEDALPILGSNEFDFIVMDINLQGEYNGLDALKIIHRMPAYVNMPIIAVTAYVLPGDKERFIKAGFVDFCAKPIFREKLIESLEKVFLK